MVRKLPNWISSFLTYAEAIPSPELFKKWTGIYTVAAALERRVWVDVGMGPLFPNIYTFLVAPPGVGKTALTSMIQELLSPLSTGDEKGLRIAAASLTSASIVDELRDATRRFYRVDNPLDPIKFNALAIVSNELGVMLPSYEPDMMNKLTDIFDAKGYSERRRWAKETKDANGFKIDAPLINIMAGTTPGYLTTMLPDGAWDMGFLSRVILVFSGEKLVRPLFSFASTEAATKKELQDDLAHIFTLYGEIGFTLEAKNALIAWHMQGGPPAPDHPRLANYATRRTTHLLKLCMVACCAAGDTLTVTVEHLNTALDWLLEAELLMPDIFKAMVVNADMKAMDECWHFAMQIYMRENQRPVAEARLIAFLMERVPSQNVLRMLQVMAQANLLKEELVADAGKCYKPISRGRR